MDCALMGEGTTLGLCVWLDKHYITVIDSHACNNRVYQLMNLMPIVTF